MTNSIIVSDMLFPHDDENALSSILNNTPVEGIELRSGTYIENDNTDDLRSYMNMLSHINAHVISVHAPFMKQDISSEDEYIRKMSVRNIEKAVMIAADVNARYTVIHCSGVGAYNEEIAFDKLKRSVDEISITAEDRGIELLIENTIPGMLVYTSEHMERINDMGLNMCFDWGHAMLSDIDSEHFLKIHSKDIKLIHFHVNNGREDQHKFDSNALKKLVDIADDNIVIEIETDINYFNYGDILKGGLAL